MPLIYNEKEMKFKIIVFDLQKAYSFVKKIRFLPPRRIGRKKTFPIYKFFDSRDNYIFEVRYGDAKANALQRGMWTHTENAELFFNELLAGGYKINEPLITLIAKILVSRKDTHEKILQHFFNFSNPSSDRQEQTRRNKNAKIKPEANGNTGYKIYRL